MGATESCDMFDDADAIGIDGMYDKERRNYVIDECKKMNVQTCIGRFKDDKDRPQTLNLMIEIPHRTRHISCIFSHHALGVGLIETQTYLSQHECSYLTHNGLERNYDEDTSNIQKWETVDELIKFVSLLNKMYEGY